MTNCQKKSNASAKSTESYCSSCPSRPKFVEEKKTCHPLTSHVTPSFSHAKESRTPYDLYWLQYYNQHAEKMDYDLVLVKESYVCSSDDHCPLGSTCTNGQCIVPNKGYPQL
jgi:hypothetical protein